MALCRFEAKIISRSGGRSTVGAASYRSGHSATSAAAYRHGAELKDERTGVIYDFSRKRGVIGSEIMLPEGAPEWMGDRGQLWNAVEKIEKRADAQLARDHILTLPHELNAGQRRDLTREFVQQEFVDKGYVADVAWHAPHGKGDDRNYHAHVMVVMRRIDGDGFARTKERPADGKHPAEQWKADLRAQREAWAEAGADALKAAGFHLEAERFRTGHLTLDKQREAAIARGDHAWAEALDREAEPKQGPLATKIEQEGRESHAGNDRRAAQARNAEYAKLKNEHAQITAEIIDLEQERRKRQGKSRTHDEPNNGVAEENRRAQAERQVKGYKEAEHAAQEQERQYSARQLREQAQRDAEEARTSAKERRETDERRAAEGEPTDARNRYAQALGAHYTIRDPYSSLADAAMAEYGAFNRQQQELKARAEAESNPQKRRMIELRREIEAHDYMAITSERLAGISRVITMSDNPSAQRDDERARAHADRATELREQRAELRQEMRDRQAERGRARPGLDPRGGDPPSPPLSRTLGRGEEPQPPQASAQRRPQREEIWGHAGQEGAPRTANPRHLETRQQREERERRLAAAYAPAPGGERDRDLRRPQRETADGRVGLRPDEPAEGRPATREGRIARREEAERDFADRTGNRGRDQSRSASRPTERGGGRGR